MRMSERELELHLKRHEKRKNQAVLRFKTENEERYVKQTNKP